MYFLYFIVYVFILKDLHIVAVHIIWDNNAIYDPEAGEEIARSDEARMPNWFFIYPGENNCVQWDNYFIQFFFNILLEYRYSKKITNKIYINVEN